MMNYAIILSGGVGSRFWPLSRGSFPKQLLSIYSKNTSIEETVRRILPLVGRNNIYIATNKTLDRKIRNYLKRFNLPKDNFFFEPSGKSTLPPVALLASRIMDLDSEAVIVVLPSDHFIKNNRIFINLLNRAIYIAKLGYIVTL
ncbi:MAG: sugar phosphate nucleotidyltransferase, partial [Candidatus Omnitrophica bacterium]|nr:sugar phosphate nucleotidyltransferase [Candidatus Omnitrophota bacterium]